MKGGRESERVIKNPNSIQCRRCHIPASESEEEAENGGAADEDGRQTRRRIRIPEISRKDSCP
jgi:hypothetical protein